MVKAWLTLGALAVVGCQRAGDAAPVRSAMTTASVSADEDTSYRAQPGYVVDSILPADETLRRFLNGIEHVPARLEGGAPSRGALVRSFVRALERQDTLALRHLAIDRAEFAYLVYPGSAYTRPPYRQSPDIVWLQLTLPGDKGSRRLIERYGGRPMHAAAEVCDSAPERDGQVRLWRHCALRFVTGSDTVTRRLFGVIVERDGRFKFASYANQL